MLEGMDCMEHWVWCKNNEYCYAENKFKKKILVINGIQTHSGNHSVMCINIKKLRQTPKRNPTLHANYFSIKKNKIKLRKYK